MARSSVSRCHLAEIMDSSIQAKHFGARPEWIALCSFCGVRCEPIPQTNISQDFEVVARRWKDGDASFKDVLNEAVHQKEIAERALMNAIRPTLTGEQLPKYDFDIATCQWKEVVR